jgi:hypothetical protein
MGATSKIVRGRFRVEKLQDAMRETARRGRTAGDDERDELAEQYRHLAKHERAAREDVNAAVRVRKGGR